MTEGRYDDTGRDRPRYDALVLAGGAGRRLGGADKALIEVGGVPLLARVLTAVADAQRVVCVGPVRATPVPVTVTWCREDPPGGGPVAAIAAGIGVLDRPAAASPGSASDVLVVLAVDLPFVDAATVRALVEAVGSGDGAVGVDGSGQAQPLLAAYRRMALVARLDAIGSPDGARARDLVAGLALDRVAVGVAATDCDTAEALATARSRAGE